MEITWEGAISFQRTAFSLREKITLLFKLKAES